MCSQDILSLPIIVAEEIFKRTPIYDLINFSLSSDLANHAVNQFNYRKTPSLEVTLKGQKESDFYVEIGVCSGVWKIEKKDRKRPRSMEKIGNDWVVIQNAGASGNLTIQAMDLLKTTNSLINHIQTIFKAVDIAIIFDNIKINKEIAQWKFIKEAKKIKMIDSPMDSNFLLSPNQELHWEGSSVDFPEGLNLKTVEIKRRRPGVRLYNCENLILSEWKFSEDEAIEYIRVWRAGELDRLKTLEFMNGYEQWKYFDFGAIEWAGGERIYETEDGEKIDCSQGIDWIREDGKLGTLVLPGIDEMGTMRQTAFFLVWP